MSCSTLGLTNRWVARRHTSIALRLGDKGTRRYTAAAGTHLSSDSTDIMQFVVERLPAEAVGGHQVSTTVNGTGEITCEESDPATAHSWPKGVFRAAFYYPSLPGAWQGKSSSQGGGTEIPHSHGRYPTTALDNGTE